MHRLLPLLDDRGYLSRHQHHLLLAYLGPQAHQEPESLMDIAFAKER